MREHASEALTELCDGIEREMDELRARYELYFLGVERLEPVRDRATLKQKVSRLLTTFTRNAGLRFRIQALHARFISYERLWSRNSREREEGTYHRDLVKARRRGAAAAQQAGKAAPAATPAAGAAPATGARGAPSLEDAGAGPGSPGGVASAGRAGLAGGALVPSPAPAPSPGPPNAPAAAPLRAAPGPARAAPTTPRPPSLPREGDPQLRALYDAYVTAKKRCNEDVSRLTYEAVAKTVAQQTPQLREKLKAKEIDFRVVIQGGRAVLKAVPRG